MKLSGRNVSIQAEHKNLQEKTTKGKKTEGRGEEERDRERERTRERESALA